MSTQTIVIATVALAMCLVCVVAILLGALLPPSYAYVDYDEMALVRSTTSGLVDTTRILEAGRHYVGLLSTLERFPTTLQHMNDSLLVFAQSGLEFTIDVDLWYRLDPLRLGDLYRKLGRSYVTRVRDTMRTTIKNTATAHTVADFIAARESVVRSMRAALNETFQSMFLDVEPGRFFLHRITFPAATQRQFEQTAVQTVTNAKAILQRNVTLIGDETKRLVAEIEADMEYVNKTTHAFAAARVQEARVTAERFVQEAEGSGIRHMFTELDIRNSSVRRTLLDLYAMLDNPSRVRVLVGGGFSTLLQLSRQ